MIELPLMSHLTANQPIVAVYGCSHERTPLHRQRDPGPLRAGLLVRANAVVSVLSHVAVHAENLKPVRVVLPLQPAPESSTAASLLPVAEFATMVSAVVFDVIDGEKRLLSFAAARAYVAAIRLVCSVSQSREEFPIPSANLCHSLWRFLRLLVRALPDLSSRFWVSSTPFCAFAHCDNSNRNCRSGTCARARDRKDLRRGPEYHQMGKGSDAASRLPKVRKVGELERIGKR
jgi:hypothetical protein